MLFVWGEGGLEAEAESRRVPPPVCPLTEEVRKQGGVGRGGEGARLAAGSVERGYRPGAALATVCDTCRSYAPGCGAGAGARVR